MPDREHRGFFYLCVIAGLLFLIMSSNFLRLFSPNEWTLATARGLLLPTSHILLGFATIYYGNPESRKWWAFLNLLQTINYLFNLRLLLKIFPDEIRDSPIPILAEFHGMVIFIMIGLAGIYLAIGLTLLFSPAIQSYQVARRTVLIFAQIRANRVHLEQQSENR